MKYLQNSVRNDLMIDAIEGGSNYWYFLGDDANYIIKKYQGIHLPLHGEYFYSTFAEAIMPAIEEGEKIPIHDIKSPHELLGILSLESIRKGEEIMESEYSEHYDDILNENSDATTADIWLQLCLMGKIVFA